MQHISAEEADGVTPYVGVWIEIAKKSVSAVAQEVTPYVGVWIEIVCIRHLNTSFPCHPLCGGVD